MQWGKGQIPLSGPRTGLLVAHTESCVDLVLVNILIC